MRLYPVVGALALAAVAVVAQPLPLASPESQGFSPDRLKRLHTYLEKDISDGQHAGAISLVARNGRIVDYQAYGFRDLEAKLPMQKDTICRIYSMTKTVATVAAMLLFEEGRFGLNDPVSKYIPEFADLKVFKGGTPEAPELEPVKSQMTIKHLMTHTAGLSYGRGKHPVDEIYKQSKVLQFDTSKEFITNLAKLPLMYQPGEKYNYSVSIDVLSYLVEVISGKNFDEFVTERILKPLKMHDTHYTLPENKRTRLAVAYSLEKGKLEKAKIIQDPKFPTGGYGLFSTVGDYARFAQMLLNGGELDGQRLLGRKTIDFMMKNHLSDLADPTTGGGRSEGFGLGGSVRVDTGRSVFLGSEGQFGWDGAASTFYRVDPKEKTLLVLFTQHVPYNATIYQRTSTLIYQALN